MKNYLKAINIKLFLIGFGLSALVICYLSFHAFLKNNSHFKVIEKPNKPPVLSSVALLTDPLNRINKDFHVPNKLHDRVNFWFQVYSKYTSTDKIIHYMDMPWLIVDTFSTLNIKYDGRLHKWTRYHKAKKFEQDNLSTIKSKIIKLSKRTNFKNISTEDKKIISIAKKIPAKNLKQKLRKLANGLRIQSGLKDHFSSALEMYSNWITEIESIMLESNLPFELARLPFVESSFNLDAKSKVGASGIWQIMPNIGKKLLTINDQIDERNSPIKATKAASKLLKENKLLLKEWPLAITAYNTGPRHLKLATKKLNSNKIEDIVSRYNSGSFKFAAQNFYAEFLAALYVEQYQEYIWGTNRYTNSPDIYKLKISKKTTLRTILKNYNLTLTEFKLLNPDIINLREHSVLHPKYYYYLPN